MKKVFYLLILFLLFICGCSVHEHTYETNWQYDEFTHYRQAICGHDLKQDESPHEFDEVVIKEATHDEKGLIQYTCILCDYTKEEETEIIEHNFSNEYSYNTIKHYYICDCGKKKDVEEHEFEEGEVVIQETKYSNGLMRYTCKCGYSKDEVIECEIVNVDKKNEVIYLVTTSVGEDISNSVGISWHCNNSGSYLIYQKEGTNEFIEVIPEEQYWSIDESYIEDAYQNKRYVCNVDLNDLEPNTKYNYKIISDNVSSKDFSFKTSNPSQDKYSFLSFVDFQYSENKTTINLVKTFIQRNPEANLITCSGDIADEAYSEQTHRYLFDNGVFFNSILAFGAGDHEYWGTGQSPIKMFARPHSYNKLFNNPNNGCEGYLNSSYYFKYNSTLFVFLDCGDSNVSSSNEIFSKQAKWLDNVLTNEKDYDFIIVCMHKSLYGDPKQDSVVRKFAPIFTTVFDKHQVDLVISGHDHEYSRTKPINNGNVSETGTVYLDLGNSGSKTRATGEDVKTSSLYNKYIDIKENNYSLGIVGTVENNVLNIYVRNLEYKDVDYVKIEKKNR